MKSHVQIPASLLNGFADKEGNIFCMNCKGEIEKRRTKKCNVEEGYFSDEEEDKLNRYETNFGELKKNIIDAYEKDKSKFVFNYREQEQTAEKFFIMCISRNPEFAKALTDSSIFYNLCSEDKRPSQQSFALVETMAATNVIEKIWDQKSFCIIKNESVNYGFVIPQNCLYTVKFNNQDGYLIVLPITSRLAIGLLDNDKISKYNDGNEEYICTKTIGDNLVNLFNRYAVYQEFASNKEDKYKYVYAKEKKDLEDDKIKETLERIRR